MYSLSGKLGAVAGVYPEREETLLGKADRFAAALGGLCASWFRPRARPLADIVEAARSHEQRVGRLSDEEILDAALALQPLLRQQGFTQELVSQAFALVREVADRKLGLRPMDVQLMGGLALLNGMVAEMETGEGKTLTATLPACTLALAGVPVHIITVNDYLAQRDAEWMAPVYNGLGLGVGSIVHGMQPEAKRRSYSRNVTYCTNKEVAFDYLRDRLVLWDRPSRTRLQLERLYGEKSRIGQLLMRGLHFAIVDEADSVLIDEARTPLIISSEVEEVHPPGVYEDVMTLARSFREKKDYSTLQSERSVELTAGGKSRIRNHAWSQQTERGEAGRRISDEQAEALVRQALVALHVFVRDKHYLVDDGKVQIIDEYTGRVMADRSWERGLHQLIEVKEGCKLTTRKETRARISYQRFFRRYLGLAGMTGTAREVAAELQSIYRLRVVTIPTNRPMKRVSLPDRVYRTAGQKWEKILEAVARVHRSGRPVLIGTRSVEASEHLSRLLTQAGLPHRVLNARQDKEEAEIIAEAGQAGHITVATNMAGRGTDVRLGPNVAEKGGLHVIATERHEARRIDRQLFGRCGRQGDPGSSEALISLEDELVTTYCGRTLGRLAAAASRRDNAVWARWLGKFVFWKAQRRAQRAHSRMRQDLLKVDEQLSESLAFTGRTE